MTKNRLLLAAAAAVLAFPNAAGAKERGYGGITYGPSNAPGVEAEAHNSYTKHEGSPGRPSPAAAPLPGTFGSSGPVLVPLVSQIDCGHDPRWQGGQTCALAPPPEIRLERPRQRPRRPSPEEVAQRLADRAVALAPRPELRITPGRRGLTGLPSYFWLRQRPRPIQARAGVRGLVVTAEARPVQYIWTFGDGSDRVTTHSGRRWTRKRPGNIRHTYETKRRYTVEIEVIWEARWRIGGSTWRHLGYFSNSDSDRYRVRDLVPVLVPYD